MPRPVIHFFSEDIKFNLKYKVILRSWIKTTILSEGCKLKELTFVFCSDNYLLSINQQYLKHDTFTDIITFDNSDNRGILYGDIFISIDRVRDNALKYGVSEREELHRVMIHGTLHLVGYGDKGKEAKKKMTERENYYLAKLKF